MKRYKAISLFYGLILFAFGVVQFSCTRSDEAVVSSKTGDVISFNASVATPLSTKVTPYNSTDKLSTSEKFGILTFTYDAANAPITQWSVFNDYCSVGYNSLSNLWEPSSTMYWPRKGKQLRFFAFAPYNDGDGTPISVKYKDALGKPQLPQIEVTINQDISKQVDLLVANSVQKIDNAKENISIEFAHSMVGITFKASKELTVSKVELSGVYDTGLLKTSLSANDMVWENLDKKSHVYTITSPTGSVVGEYFEFDKSLTMIMLPQILPDGARIVATLSNGSTIECDLSGHTWERGKLITYFIKESSIEKSDKYNYFLNAISELEQELPNNSTVNKVTLDVESYWQKEDLSEKVPVDVTALYSLNEYGPFYRYDEIPSTSALSNILSNTTDPVTISKSGVNLAVEINFKGNVEQVSVNKRAVLKQSLATRAPLPLTDLSMWNTITCDKDKGYGEERNVPITANCYVIRQQGKYKFPCVYGNAIDGKRGEETAYSEYDNKRAYNPFDTYPSSADESVLTKFMNFKSSGTIGFIESPFIHLDPDVNPSGDANDIASNYEAVIVWQDVEASDGFLKSLEIATESMKGSKIGDVPYIKFEIDNKIQEGNVLIALRNKSTKTIVWSWHIWVSGEEDLNTVDIDNFDKQYNGGGYTTSVMPVPLGWNWEENYSYYPDRVFYVKFKQNGSSLTTPAFKIEQLQQIISGDVGGSSTFYQWGRKDPMLPNAVTYSTLMVEGVKKQDIFKSCNSPSGYTLTSNSKTLVTEYFPNLITTSITKPHIFNLTYSGSYSNLWDGDMTHYNTDKPVKKTIYDPSPPEFTVPRRNFATGFSIPGSSTSGEDRMYLAFDSGEEGYYYKNGHNVGVYVRRSTSDTKGYLIFAQCLVGSGNGAFYGEHNHSHMGYYWTVAKSTYNEANYLHFNIDPSKAKNPFVQPTVSGNLLYGRTIIAAKEE